MVSIGAAERRARLAVRHRLAGAHRADDAVSVARSVVGLHASDPASVYLATLARSDLAVADVEAALYDDRSLVRMVGMRRTLFVLPLDTVPAVHRGVSVDVARQERRRLVQLVEQAGVAPNGDKWLAGVEADTLAALAARGEAVARDLAADVPALRRRIRFGAGKKWEGEVALSTRVLFYLAATGRIVRGRPRGTWISSQYRWAPIERWLPAGFAEIPTDEARAEVVRRWLGAFGPGRLADLKWWTGWTIAATRTALTGAGAAEVALDDGVGYVLPTDLEPTPAPEPWAALLPALDPTVMGWADRSWFLDPHRPHLFDRNGNAGPTVWWDGRVVGGWGQTAAGDVAVRLLEDVGADAEAAIAAQAERLQRWLDGVRVTPRFRTPLERDLSR